MVAKTFMIYTAGKRVQNHFIFFFILNGCYMKPRLLGISSHRVFVSIKLLWSTPNREIGYYLWPIRNQLSLKTFATNCSSITLVSRSIQLVSPYLLLCWIGTQTQCTSTGSLVDQAAIVWQDVSTTFPLADFDQNFQKHSVIILNGIIDRVSLWIFKWCIVVYFLQALSEVAKPVLI